jgi:hypothetical protein
MTEILEFLHAEWAGAPLAIWLAGAGILVFFLFALKLAPIRRIHLQWKGRKHQLLIETDNVTVGAGKKKR